MTYLVWSERLHMRDQVLLQLRADLNKNLNYSRLIMQKNLQPIFF